MAEPKKDKTDLTDFGASLATLFVGLFFVFAAFYLGPYPEATVGGFAVPVNGVVRWGFLGLAAVCFVFFVGFWGVAMGNAPEMGRFFKGIWGGGEKGWQDLSQSAVLLIAAFVVHQFYALFVFLSGVANWLAWLRVVAWVVQVPVLVLALMASVMLSYAFDAFFVRPVLEATAEGGKRYEALVEAVRKRGVVVVSVLVALITLYVEIF